MDNEDAEEQRLLRANSLELRQRDTTESQIAKLTSALEQNHLAALSRDQLFEDVEDFAQDNDLSDKIPILRKGALLAQGEKDFSKIPGVTSAELLALENEVLRKWSQPRTLYFTVLVCSIGAVVQGWCQTGSNGANLSFPTAFGIGSDDEHDTLLVGLINSAPYICVGLLGAWVADPINNALGRRGSIFLGGSICFLSVLASAISQNWQQLLVFRLCLGLGLGINATTVSVYAAESAPAAIRGGLAVSWQMWTAFGIFLGFCANLAVVNYGKISWRLQLGSAFIPTVPLVALIYFCPESPSWHIKSSANYRAAFTSLVRLRNTELQAARDLYYMHSQRQAAAKVTSTAGGGGGKASFLEKLAGLFTVPRNRRAAVAAAVVMLSQQLCGINIIAFYSSTIFSSAGSPPSTALLASCAFGLTNFLFAFPAVWTIDSFGRRSLLLLTFPNMAWTMLAAGFCFRIALSSSLRLPLLAIFIFLFTALYSPGAGPVPFTYAAEVFPLSHREVGMSFAVSTSAVFASLLALSFPRLLAGLGSTGAFALYAGGNLVAWVLVFLFLPETKMRTLEELDGVFGVATGERVKGEVEEMLAWVRRRKGGRGADGGLGED